MNARVESSASVEQSVADTGVMLAGGEFDRSPIYEDWARIRADVGALLAAASRSDLARRTEGTSWTNRQMLWHMVFGFVIVRRLLPLVRLFGRLPGSSSRVFSAGLDSLAGPFDRVNYVGGVLGSWVFSGPRLEWLLDRTLDSLQRRLDAESEAVLGRSMHFPVRWDPFFADSMTLADVYCYAAQHYDFHRAQLTLASPQGGL